MEIKAKVKNLRVAPRKSRLVVDAVRGLSVYEALDQLQFINKKVTKPVEKLIRSAVANAVNSYELEDTNLFIKEIRVDEGKTLKRWKPRARGRASMIRKRTSHINLILDELVESGKKKAIKQDIAAPVKLSEMNKVNEEKVKKDDKNEKSNKSKKQISAGPAKKDEKNKAKSGFSNKLFRRKSG